ncbi:MAG: hypothetical protein SO152_02790 [Ruminococcus sp.]|nr:hypothetical protein [Ruminococcus sp.]
MDTIMDIYITLDYELFLGEACGTPENCLIKPMDRLCRIADEFHFKYIIFVDASYLLRMHQLRNQYPEVLEEFNLVANHVKKLANEGHDIQLHFHPQWLYSAWGGNEKRWLLDRTHYKLSDMPYEDVAKYLPEAKDLLDSIIGYKTTAYRAGGFCLDSFERYRDLFLQLGLVIDSSVARGQFVKSPIHYYDYRNVPKKQIYYFNTSIKKEVIDGPFKELSISSTQWNPFYFAFKIRNRRMAFEEIEATADGRGISDGKILYWERIKKMFRPSVATVSIDGGETVLLGIHLLEHVKRGEKEMIIIGHPKFVSKSSADNIFAFLKQNQNILTIKTTCDLL